MAGYEVDAAPVVNCLEIAGPGNWNALEQACQQFVKRSYRYDHVSIVIRDADGHRMIRDVGVNGVRSEMELPSLARHWTQRKGEYSGVRKSGKKFMARIWIAHKEIYIGTYADAITAAKARDKYVIGHGLTLHLNFPIEAIVA